MKPLLDYYGRTVAVCYAGQINLSDWIVRNGWGVAYRQYSFDYTEAEHQAKTNNAGLWGGTFDYPWDWRKGLRPVTGLP
jgi:endonuclease YncB( thermonuclease family)